MRSSPAARTIGVLAAAVFAVSLPAVAHAAGADTPAVDVVPAGMHAGEPNGGLWFVHRLEAGAHGHGAAMLINPARVPQMVHLYARAVDFSPTGVASVSDDAAAGVATWVHFARTSVVVPPSARVTVGYDVSVPVNADPGDHTGAIVAESGPLVSGRVTVVKRIATRFYVTVPGRVVVAFALGKLTHALRSPLWPHSIDAQVPVVNTGTIRFTPHVTVDGTVASGSSLVLAHSIEPFAAKVHVPWWGGHVRLRVVATADGEHPQVLTTSFWVIPWLLVAALLVVLGAVVHATSYVVRRVRHRRREERALRERLAELEQALPTMQDGASVSR